MSDAVQWLAFAFLSVVAMLGFRKRIYEKIRKPAGVIDEPLRTGDRVTLSARLEPGETCRVEYRGSTWTARNIDRAALSGEVEIAQVEGLTLHVRQLNSSR
jgi:membrane protein implicated in regulation of membrane protease activity